MTTEGWIFMVGFRLFDVGLLIVWLVWFFRLRDDGDDPPGEDDGGGGEGPGRGPSDEGPDGGLPAKPAAGRGGLERLPLGRARPWRRTRDHSPAPRTPRRRGPELPVPRPLPARVRRPATPAPARRARM